MASRRAFLKAAASFGAAAAGGRAQAQTEAAAPMRRGRAIYENPLRSDME